MTADNEAGISAPLPEPSARAVFLAWERLRLVYNAALAAVVLAVAGRDLADPQFHEFLIPAALGANLCFCLGPVVEGYLALIGADRLIARWLLFSSGLLLGCVLAGGSLLVWRA